MGSDKAKAWGAETRLEALLYAPEALTIPDDPQHPLHDPNVPPLDEDVVQTMDRVGVLQPIRVAHGGHSKSGAPIIFVVEGRKRVRHAREVNRRRAKRGDPPLRVPAVTATGAPVDQLLAMVVGNEHRWREPPLVRARKAKGLLDAGYSPEEVRQAFRVNQSGLDSLLSLLNLDKEAQAAVDTGVLPQSVAQQLAKLPHEEQRETFAKLKEEGALGVRGAAAKTVEETVGDRGRVRARRPPLRSRKWAETYLASIEASPIANTIDGEVAAAILRLVLQRKPGGKFPRSLRDLMPKEKSSP